MNLVLVHPETRKRVASRRPVGVPLIGSAKLKQGLGRGGLLHGFEHGVHAGLAAGSRVAMQDWGVAHLVEKSTQTADWVVASPTSSPRSDDSKALVWFLRRTLRQRFSAVRRTVWRTRFLVDSLFGNAITSSDQWTASFGEAQYCRQNHALWQGEPQEAV